MTSIARTARATWALGWLAVAGASTQAQDATPATRSASAPERLSVPDARQKLQGAALLRALREGGLVIYFRHTASDFSKNDQASRDDEDCDNQRPLSEQGRNDARAIGKAIAALKLPIGVVKASPMCRTMEHARLMLGTAIPTSTMRELSNGEYLGLKRLLAARMPLTLNRWLIGHGIPFRAVAGPPQLAEGEAVVLRPTGESWVILARLTVADWATLGTR